MTYFKGNQNKKNYIDAHYVGTMPAGKPLGMSKRVPIIQIC